MGAISASFETALGGLEWRPNHPTGRGAFTCQPLHGTGQELGGVSWHWPSCRTADVTGVSSSLRPPLCCYSQRRAGLLLTLLSAPILYTASAQFRVAFPLEYSPKIYQSTEPKRQETIY
jgi:hypothetical protein